MAASEPERSTQYKLGVLVDGDALTYMAALIIGNDDRVTVAVSAEMEHLRSTQRFLNQFLWSTELAYRYFLARGPAEFTEGQRLAAEAMSDISSQAWYLNAQGRMKYRETVDACFGHVKANPTNLCRAVLVFFYSAFEDYLERRVRPLTTAKRRWAPFYRGLAIPELTQAHFRPRLVAILRADLCRKIRNRIVHPPFQPPTDASDPEVRQWRNDVHASSDVALWRQALKPATKTASRDIFRNAAYEVSQAASEGRHLPFDFFFVLYTFTNLDTVAFQIEEALVPRGSRPSGRILRHPKFVRRAELITDTTPNPALHPTGGAIVAAGG